MLLNTHHMWALANSQLLSEARYRYSYERPFNTIHSSRADVFLNTLNNCIMTFFSHSFSYKLLAKLTLHLLHL